MKALIVVDVQNDFCEGGSLAVNGSNEIIPVINKLMSKDEYDLIVFTHDWHPQNHKSFASNWDNKNVFDVVELGGIVQVLWPDHCVAETYGSQIHKDIYVDSNVEILNIKKGLDSEVDSYSGFFDNDHKTSTGLKEELNLRGITEVDVCGLATDYCVKYTAIDANNSGFKTNVIMDASAGVFLGGAGDKIKVIEELIQERISIKYAK